MQVVQSMNHPDSVTVSAHLLTSSDTLIGRQIHYFGPNYHQLPLVYWAQQRLQKWRAFMTSLRRIKDHETQVVLLHWVCFEHHSANEVASSTPLPSKNRRQLGKRQTIQCRFWRRRLERRSNENALFSLCFHLYRNWWRQQCFHESITCQTIMQSTKYL